MWFVRTSLCASFVQSRWAFSCACVCVRVCSRPPDGSACVMCAVTVCACGVWGMCVVCVQCVAFPSGGGLLFSVHKTDTVGWRRLQ